MIQYADGKSVLGWISSALLQILSLADIGVALQIILTIVGIAVGITTLIYNRMRIKQLKEKEKE